MTEVFARFIPTPKDQRGRVIIPEIEGNGISRLRQMTKGRQAERYKLRLEFGEKRSLSQNDRFHAMAHDYAEKTGYTLDQAKVTLKHEGGVIHPWGPGFIPPIRKGCFVEIYGEIEYQVSTAVYTKKEFTVLMDTAERLMASL